MRVRSPYSLRSIGSVYPRGFGREKSYNALENMLLKLATIPFSPSLLKFTRYHALLIIANLFASFTHVVPLVHAPYKDRFQSYHAPQ